MKEPSFTEWLSDDDRIAYEQRISDFKLDYFLDELGDTDLWAYFIEAWYEQEMVDFVKSGKILNELKKYSVELLKREWAERCQIPEHTLTDFEINEITSRVNEIFIQ